MFSRNKSAPYFIDLYKKVFATSKKMCLLHKNHEKCLLPDSVLLPPPAKKSNECSLIRNTPFPSYTYQLPCFGSHVLYGSALKSGLILSVNNGISLFHLSGQVGVILRNLHFPVCCHQCPPALLSLHIAHTSFSTCLSPVKMKHYFKYNFTK